MAGISILLTFPKTSNGLIDLKSTVSEMTTNDTGLASPRRKVPRLDTDFDSASASRSHVAATAHLASRVHKSSPLTIHLVGGNLTNKPVSGDKELALLRRCIRVVLNPIEDEILPGTNYVIYSACRTVVSIAKRGEDLYGALQMELEKCVSSLLRLCTRSDKRPVEWISFFVSTCTWFEIRIALLVSLLTYLDQEYIISNNSLKPIRSTAYALFGEFIFGNPIIIESIQEGVKDWVDSERNDQAPHSHRQYIPLLINQLVSHGQYSIFEQHYVTITREYYIAESQRLAEEQEKDPQAFFRHVRGRIIEEEARSKEALPLGSWELVRETTERALWDGRLDWLANETIGPYVEGGQIESLEAMYNLFGRVDGLKVLYSAFRKFVTLGVVKIVKDTEHDEEMVDRLLDFKRLTDNTIHQAFSPEKPLAVTSTSTPPKLPDKKFVYALADAFTDGFRTRRNKPAEMIAKYLDKAMRTGQGEGSDAEFDKMLNEVLGLYRFSEDKDVFRTFYHRSLAKRLLLEKSASNDFEVSMLKRMKDNYDPEFSMGEDMFKDLGLSRESMKDYHSKLDDDHPGKNLNVMVLQRSAWPFSMNDKEVDLSPDMQEQINKFSEYYKGKHSGHALEWDHALGTATLRANFVPGVKELSVSLYQAVVLLLFNDSVELSFQDIKDQTRMNDAELRRTLQSLACGKKKVLKKIPPGRDINDDDTFRFNADFSDPRPRVHINSIQVKVTPEESKRTNQAVEGDRKHYLDAAIVRIMKGNKTMTYEKLKAATIDAVKNHFVPQVDVIKQRVDALVESDYLERDKLERNKFHYVA